MAEAVIMPKTGMAMEEGVIIEWLKQEGDPVKEGEVIAQIETDKSTMDLESDVSGTLLKLVYEAGATVPVTVAIAWIGEEGERIPEEHSDSGSSAPVQAEEDEPKAQDSEPALLRASSSKVPATPAAKRVAAEKAIDLASVQPSGKHGEVLQKDVLAHAPKATPLAERIAKDRQIDLTGISGSGHAGKIYSRDVVQAGPVIYEAASEDTRVPLTTIQKITGKRMMESVSHIPMVSENISVDMTRLLELKQTVLDEGELKASVNDFIIRAVALSLRKHPRMNSVFDTDALIYRHQVHIGMAVATEKGLLVPVLRDADRYSFAQLVSRTRQIIEKAREGKLAPEELSGSTFSISNVGMYGITSFTPIINPPEAGILGVCAIEQLPRFINDTLEKRSIMTICLTFDHRIVDGAESAQFLQTLKHLLEAPLQLLI